MNTLRRRLLKFASEFESFMTPGRSISEVVPCLLLDVGSAGELSVNSGRIDPSFATPQITLSKCIASVRRSADGKDFEGELTVEGTVRSSLCDSLPSGKAAITEVIFSISEDIRSFQKRVIEVHGTKSRTNDPLHPFPFEGHFAAVLKGITVTSGTNAFYFRAKDPVSQLTAESVWAAIFSLPYDEIGDDEEEEASTPVLPQQQLQPTVTSAPAEVDSALGLDPVFYCIGVPGRQEERELAFGPTGEQWYPLKASPALPDLVVPIDPATGGPLLFTLVPGGSGRARDFWEPLSKQKDFIPLEGRARFLAAFYQGLLSNGVTLSAGGVSYVEPFSFCEDSGRCEIPIRIRREGKVQPGTLRLPLKFAEEGMEDRKRIGDLVWRWREMAVNQDPRLGDFEMGLITGDPNPGRIEDIHIEGWTSDFLSMAMVAMQTTLKEGLTLPDLGQAGFSLGLITGEAMRVAFEMRGEKSRAAFFRELARRL